MLTLVLQSDMPTQSRLPQEQETRRSIQSYENRANTGYATLDVLLTQKLIQADAQETTLTYLVDGAEFAALGEVDIYALFGDVLDNALEATGKIADPQRHVINLKATKRQELLVIACGKRHGGHATYAMNGGVFCVQIVMCPAAE